MTMQRTAPNAAKAIQERYAKMQAPEKIAAPVERMIGIHFPHIRLTIEQKRRCKRFSELFDNSLYKYIDFGKQDTRGSISITWFDMRDCVPRQEHFIDKSEMLGYITGYIEGK